MGMPELKLNSIMNEFNNLIFFDVNFKQLQEINVF